MTTDSTDGEIAGELRGGVLIYKRLDGEFINIRLGSEQVRSLNEWFATQRIKSVIDGGGRGPI